MIANTGTKNAPIVTRKVVNCSSRPKKVAPMIEMRPRMSAVGRNFTFAPGTALTTDVTMP